MGKVIGGILLFIATGVLALYLGVWVCFIGGIVSVVEGIKATPVNSMQLAVGIAKVLASGFVGWGSFIIGAIASGMLFAVGANEVDDKSSQAALNRKV